MAKTTRKKAADATESNAPVVEQNEQPTQQGGETAQAQEEQKLAVTLFGQIGFKTLEEYEGYIASLKQKDVNNILVTVNVALRSVVQRGVLSMEENEAVSVALRYLNSLFVPKEEPQAENA